MASTHDDKIAELERTIAELRRERDAALAKRNSEYDERIEHQSATIDVLKAMSASPGDPQPVFDLIVRRAAELCNAPHAVLFRYEDGLLHWKANSSTEAFASSEALGALKRRFPMAPMRTSLIGRAILDRRLGHVRDIDAETGVFQALRDISMKSFLSIPLLRDGIPLGAIGISAEEPGGFSDSQVALMEAFAEQAVIAIGSAETYRALQMRTTDLQESLEQQTATAEVLQVINSSPGNLAPVFDAVLEKALRLCESAFGSLHTYDGKRIFTWATRGMPPELVDRLRQPIRPNPGTGFYRIIHGEDVVHVADITDDDVYRSGSPARMALVHLGGARTQLLVALRKEDILLGMINVYRQEIRLFSDKQIALLQSFAAQAVIAMENVRLITEQREALEQQTATAEVLQVINASPGNLGPVFDAMLDKAMRLCEAAFGVLFTYDGEDFVEAASRGLPPAYADFRQCNKDLTKRVATARRHVRDGANVLHIADLKAEEAYLNGEPLRRALVDLGGARTGLWVALRKDDALLGAIMIYRQEVSLFNDRQVALLQNFAAQAVIAMENARLLGELRQRTDEVAELNRGLEARVAAQVEELGRIGRLKRFLAPQLAELIVSQGKERILESHRREIVVVFCDLRGYTAFTETAEPEEVLDFLREYHGALGPLVSQFEGTLDQFSGDGIMVFFNDPVPISDPAERAVKMAIAMREAAGTLIADWRERGRDLGFGAGIAQGYATLGQIGFSERAGYTAIGTVCNVAARLCAEAKDSQILLSQRVNAALKRSIVTEKIGALALKGLAQPAVAYNVPFAEGQVAFRVIEGGTPSV